ncbi:hypothetical protein OKA04_22695 [Luteolibacter flavescens]|uniref:Tetracyclin repressor-like C-terminal domain-containing protein n=1 Tax=Luteolibacter flavescens TaxID=1859460 RepID=A0ABT3FVD9_9BACT|nr:hypothetical protein [Luteolibacter flavescens]MCW1887563.1 hypothetical protein [Luteolibacter flavescens]
MSAEHAHLEAALPGFSRARELLKAAGDSVAPLGFTGTKFDFYRFVNRFRLATCFEGMRLDGFTDGTAAGYDALTRVFFAWSAFERYADLANDRPPFRALFAHHPRRHVRELACHCRSLDPEGLLGEFLVAQSLPVHEPYLRRFLEGHDFSVLTLAASIRHIFAHGILTAHPNGMPAENLSAIGRSLGNFLIHFMRSDFSRRLALAEVRTGGEG